MELGMIGLGRMEGNMACRLLNGGHKVIVFDPVPEAVRTLVKQGAVGTSSIAELTSGLSAPRTVWLMVPAGEVTESTVAEVAANLSAGDCLIDGGNSYYKDSMRRASVLSEKNIYFLDVGTSGGIWGLKEGYCLMVGGEVAAFQRLEPIFQTLAPSPDKGYGHVGPSWSRALRQDGP